MSARFLSLRMRLPMAVVGLSFVLVGSLRAQEWDAANDFASGWEKLATSWPEGHMAIRSEHSVFGATPIEVWWKPGVRRLHFIDTFSDHVNGGHSLGEPCILILSGRSVCRIYPDLLMCECRPRHTLVQVQPNLRILPTEGWMELAPEQSFERMGSRGDSEKSKTVRTADGGYEMTVYPKRIAGLAERPPRDAEVFRARFDVSCRPLDFGPLDEQGEGPALRGRFQWDASTRAPRQMVIESKAPGEDQFRPYWDVTVQEYQDHCEQDAGFFRFPPSELPFGTLVEDSRGGKTVRRYVGGAAGRRHREIWRKARELERISQ